MAVELWAADQVMRLDTKGFRTGEWTVEPRRNLLSRGGGEVRVEPRVMDVLVYLAERAGQVVLKDELVERVWEGRCVSDDALTVTVYALRKALGDDARRPAYVETVSRRGYRWIAPVTPTDPAAPAVRSAPTDMDRPGGRSYIGWVALALLVACAGWVVTSGRHVPSPEAHEAYVKGRYFLDQRSVQGWRQAQEHFQRALALDPQYPAAHAGLADTYSAMADFGIASPAELRPRAMQAAGRALELNSRSAEGHAALGRAQFLFDWNFSAAERSLKRAAALDPDYMPAQQSLAWLRSAQGNVVAAVAAAKRALQLDPVNTARYTELAWVLSLGGRFDEALREVERALLLNPRSVQALVAKGWTLEMAGQPAAAFAAYREALRLGGAPEDLQRRMDAAYRAEGLAGYYRTWLSYGGAPRSETWRAQLYVRTGQLDRAMESLAQALQRREGALAWVRVDPGFQPLRSDARFRGIADRVGF